MTVRKLLRDLVVDWKNHSIVVEKLSVKILYEKYLSLKLKVL